MKKIVLKIGFISVCILAIIFLLLPFLETEAPVVSQLHKVPPQITSENPLTKLAKRLASLFGHKERAQRMFNAHTEEPSPYAKEELLYAAAKPSQTEVISQTTQEASTTVSLPADQAPFDYADASFQTDNGEWVLIKQTAPQSSAPGMHEINVHENPYDRYMKQERVRRFQSATPTQEIPDSKWARLTRPLKYLLSGNEVPRSVTSAPMRVHPNVAEPSPMLAAASTGKGTTGFGTHRNANASYGPTRALLGITPQQWAHLTPEERERARERHAAHEFSQLISGDRAAQQAAEIAADTKYPNPQNKQEEQEKEKYKQRMTEENKQKIKAGLLTNIQTNATGKEPVDELSYMTGCKDASLPTQADACSIAEGNTSPAHAPQEQLQAQQAQNKQAFFERTKYVLPQGLPFTVVLGPTKPENLESMQANPSLQQTGEIYQFMYKQQQCSSRTCYWVPNSNQVDPQLADAFFTINDAHLKTDPQHTYASYAEPFVQDKINKLGAGATPEQIQQVTQQAQEQLANYRPNWVPYTEDQLRQMHQDTLAALTAGQSDLSATTEPVFPFVTDPAIAPQIAELIGPASFVYNNTSLVNSSTAVEAGEQMTDSLIQNVNGAKEVFNEVTQNAISEGVRTQINQQINNQNQNGGGFAGLLNLFKSSTQK